MPLHFPRGLFLKSFANKISLLSNKSASLSIQSSNSGFLKYQSSSREYQVLQQLSQDEMYSCHHMLMTEVKRLSRNQITADTLQLFKSLDILYFPFLHEFLEKTDNFRLYVNEDGLTSRQHSQACPLIQSYPDTTAGQLTHLTCDLVPLLYVLYHIMTPVFLTAFK